MWNAQHACNQLSRSIYLSILEYTRSPSLHTLCVCSTISDCSQARLRSVPLGSGCSGPSLVSSAPACVNALPLPFPARCSYMRIAGHCRGNSWQVCEYMCFCRDQLSYVSNAAAAQLRAAPHIWPALESLSPPFARPVGSVDGIQEQGINANCLLFLCCFRSSLRRPG